MVVDKSADRRQRKMEGTKWWKLKVLTGHYSSCDQGDKTENVCVSMGRAVNTEPVME